MAMPPRVRNFALTAHVTCSVGWIGAVAGYLALAVAGLTSPNLPLTRGVYLAMDLLAWQVILPLSLGSLVTGVIQSLGTSWGLFRHYWVIFKLLLNLLATAVLIGYAQSTGHFASIAADAAASGAALAELRNRTHVLHATGGLLTLLVATVLAIYKPRGMTRYGQRRQRAARAPAGPH